MRLFDLMTRKASDKDRKGFIWSDAGGVTIEAALWIPFWIFFLFGLAQTAFIFHGQARMLDVAQDATRAYAIGYISSTSALETSVRDALSTFSDNITVNTSETDGIVKTVVTIPAMDFGIGVFKSLEAFDLRVASQAVKET